MQRWNIVALEGGWLTEPAEPAQRYVYLLFFSFHAKGNIVDIRYHLTQLLTQLGL